MEICQTWPIAIVLDLEKKNLRFLFTAPIVFPFLFFLFSLSGPSFVVAKSDILRFKLFAEQFRF